MALWPKRTTPSGSSAGGDAPAPTGATAGQPDDSWSGFDTEPEAAGEPSPPEDTEGPGEVPPVSPPTEAGSGSVLDASPDTLAEVLRARMLARRSEEIARGVTLVGPHRDDLVLSLGHLPAKGYASHGESWSFALALRLGAYAMLRADGVEPVLILDDVFAELDEVRRARLAERILGAEQVLITAAVASDVPAALAGRRYRIADGTVTPVSEQESDRDPDAEEAP